MIKKEQAAYISLKVQQIWDVGAYVEFRFVSLTKKTCNGEVLQTRVKLKPNHSHRFIFKEWKQGRKAYITLPSFTPLKWQEVQIYLCLNVQMQNFYNRQKQECDFWHFCSTTMPCYHTRASEHTQYATVLHCRSEQKYGRKAQQQNGHTELSNKKLFFFLSFKAWVFKKRSNNFYDWSQTANLALREHALNRYQEILRKIQPSHPT